MEADEAATCNRNALRHYPCKYELYLYTHAEVSACTLVSSKTLQSPHLAPPPCSRLRYSVILQRARLMAGGLVLAGGAAAAASVALAVRWWRR